MHREMQNPSYWLPKTEPETYNFSQLHKDKKTNWNGVRNFQARNFLRQAKEGDLALIYHSGEERAVVGIARVVRSAYPDPDNKKPGDWVQIDLQFDSKLKNPVSLKEIKTEKRLKDLLLIKQSRLSVMPVSSQDFKLILNMGEAV